MRYVRLRACPLCLAAAVWLVTGACPIEGAGGKAAGVPPGQEIEVLDPSADPTGKPAVLLQSQEGRVQVTIPPTVLVHRYYYTGNRSFQAQLLPGGPTIVVVNHPKTGEQCYIEVQMPPGAPRVTYTGHSIEYDFGRQGVSILFLPLCQPRVVYRNGISAPRAAAHVTTAAGQGVGRLVQASGIPECTAKIASGTKSAVCAATEGAKDLGRQAAAPVQSLLRMTPLGGIFTGDPTSLAQRRRDEAVRRAEEKAAQAEVSIPSLR